MRKAKCVSLTAPIAVHGSKEGVTITTGWEGDLDRVVGVNGDGTTLTLGDAIGPVLLEQHFEIEEPPAEESRGARKTASAKAKE